MSEKNICYNCFKDKDENKICPHCGFNLQENRDKYPNALPAGTVLGGKYILGRVLGQGGFGITYLAQNYQTKELVAVKEYFPEAFASRTNSLTVSSHSGSYEENFNYGKKCFLDEAKTLAQFIGNTNIVSVYSYFEENNTAYFAMEYIEGTSFQKYIQNKGGRISWEEATQILYPVMDALAAVHAKGIIHRDISPDNIYIKSDGTVKLLDFGAARYSVGDRSRSLTVVLKHGYAPKEQYTRHGKQGPYTDIYALAATFYKAITGKLPPDSIDRIEEDDLVLPSSIGCSISPEAEDALLKALSINAADRYQDINSFKKGLQGIEKPDFSSVTAEKYKYDDATTKPEITNQNMPAPVKKMNKAIPIIIIALVAVLIGVLIITIFFSVGKEPANRQYTTSAADEESTTKAVETTKDPSVEVPSFKNKSLSFAKSELEKLDFTVKTEYEYSSSVEKDCVISQSIDEGTKVIPPTTITLTISKGKKPESSSSKSSSSKAESKVTSSKTESKSLSSSNSIGKRVDFTFFSLAVPNNWTYITVESSGQVIFYEATNYKNNGMGRLVAIDVFNSKAEIETFKNQGNPRTTLLGSSNGMYFTYTLPSDVQYTGEGALKTNYMNELNRVKDILDTIEYK